MRGSSTNASLLQERIRIRKINQKRSGRRSKRNALLWSPIAGRSTAGRRRRPRCRRPASSASTPTNTRSRRAPSAGPSRCRLTLTGSSSSRMARSSANIAAAPTAKAVDSLFVRLRARSRPYDLQSLALRAGAGPKARRLAQWRAVQGLGAVGRARARARQTRRRQRRRLAASGGES